MCEHAHTCVPHTKANNSPVCTFLEGSMCVLGKAWGAERGHQQTGVGGFSETLIPVPIS